MAAPAPPATVTIQKYADDVPCSALVHTPDGVWTIPGTIIVAGAATMSNIGLKDTPETRLWAAKCPDQANQSPTLPTDPGAPEPKQNPPARLTQG